MAQKVTLKEIAQNTGVSLGTVHRAIYGKSGVREDTRQRILDEVRRLNYQVDETASALKRHEKRVAVVLPRAQKEERFYFRGLWQAIRQAAGEMERHKIQYEYIESPYPLSEIWRELERVYDEQLDEIDGLITAADGEEASVWISRFAKRRIPIVLLSSHYIGDSPMVSCIKGDHERCGSLAAEFMQYGVKPGGGKILLLGGDERVYSNSVYARRFEKEMQNRGYDLLRINGFGWEEIEAPCRQCLETERIQGVFVANARNTYAVCRIMTEMRLGEDILVVGSDVFEELRPYYESGLLNATICQYQWEQGNRAVKQMYEYLIRGNILQKDEMMPPVLLMKNNYEYFL